MRLHTPGGRTSGRQVLELGIEFARLAHMWDIENFLISPLLLWY
jgi:hypothetical protein